MFGRFFALASALLFLGCARPEYLDSNTNPVGSPENSSKAQASFPQQSLNLSIVWQKMQTDEDMGAFWIKFWRPNAADQSPVPVELNQEISLRLWMPSMGHGSSPVSISKVDMGTYLVEDVYFSMPGDWEIQIQLKNPDGSKDEAAIAIHF